MTKKHRFFCNEICVLNINSFKFGHESYYFNDKAHSLDLEDRGQWTQQATNLLGLDGSVELSQFQDFINGLHPVTNDPLEYKLPAKKIAGFDFVFSAPKSVSVLAMLTDSDTERTIRQAHQLSVSNAMDFVSANCMFVSRSYDGQRHFLKTTGALGASFYHKTSRSNDPHIHSHVVMANIAKGYDSRFSAAHVHTAYILKRHISSIYHVSLRNEITKNLQVDWDRYRYGLAEIKGIDDKIIFAFSKRRQQLLGIFNDSSKDFSQGLNYFLENKAQYDPKYQRPAKRLDANLVDLRQSWCQKLNSLGLSSANLLNNAQFYRTVDSDKKKDCPTYVKDLIGEHPKDPSAYLKWSKTAAQIEIYRNRFNIKDELRPLGKSKFEIMREPNFSLRQLSELKKLEVSINEISIGQKVELQISRGL